MSDTLVSTPMAATAVQTVSAALESALDGIFSSSLTLLDRCDGCGAAAKAQVFVESEGTVLLLCGHHFNRGKDRFVEKGHIWRLGDCNNHDAFNCDCENKVMKSRTQGEA